MPLAAPERAGGQALLRPSFVMQGSHPFSCSLFSGCHCHCLCVLQGGVTTTSPSRSARASRTPSLSTGSAEECPRTCEKREHAGDQAHSLLQSPSTSHAAFGQHLNAAHCFVPSQSASHPEHRQCPHSIDIAAALSHPIVRHPFLACSHFAASNSFEHQITEISIASSSSRTSSNSKRT